MVKCAYLMVVWVIGGRSGHHSSGGRNGFVSVVNHLIHASHTTSIYNHINFVHLCLQSHGVIGTGASTCRCSTCCTCVVIACHYASIGTCTFWSQRVIYMTHFNLCKSIAKNYLSPGRPAGWPTNENYFLQACLIEEES